VAGWLFLKHADEKIKYQLPAMALQQSIEEEIERQCKAEKVTATMIRSGSRRSPVPKLRRTIALKLINEYGVSLAETARQVGISTSGVAQILKRNKGG
jgi:REP-associated tyrosine transposase